MPALNVDFDALEDKGFIKVLSGNDYLTVSGRLFLAHSSGQLIGIKTEEMYPDDPDFITIMATVTIFNPMILAQIERIAISKAEALIDDDTKFAIVSGLIHNALINTFTGMAQSKRKGGKSAEGTNPREVAETSAVGRALGNAGFGDTESFASFEEMMVALSRDGSEPAPKPAAKSTTAKKPAAKKPADPNKPTTEQKKELFELAQEHLGVTTKDEFAEAVEARCGKKIEVLTASEVDEMIKELKGEEPMSTPSF